MNILEWRRQFQKEEDYIMRCRRLVVTFMTSTDREIVCRNEETYFFINTKKNVEKELYEARFVHDDV